MATTTEQPGPAGPATAAPTDGSTEQQGMVPTRPGGLARANTMAQAFAGLMPTSIGEVVLLSTHLAKSKAIPQSLAQGGPDTVFTVIWAGMELGLTPIRALQSISNISGTLCMKADLQLALVQNRHVLAFYDEGFERYGQTDTNLGKRVKLALGKVLRKLGATDADVADEVDLVVEKIAAMTATGMKDGDPYGWAVGMRHGDPAIHVRAFTFADAEKAIIYEKDEGNPAGPKERKPLSQKFNYKSFPADMYPKRARTRLLQILASDVTNGLPAVEAVEGGQIIDAEFTVSHPEAGDDLDTLLAQLRDEDSEAATTVENGFKQLSMGKAAQLQKLTQFKGKPKDLVEWLKTEWAARKGKDRQRADVLGDPPPAQTQPAKPAAPSLSDLAAQAQTTTQPGPQLAKPGDIIDAEVTGEDEPPAEQQQPLDARAHAGDGDGAAAEARAAAQPMTPARDLAARFRSGKMKTF